MTATLRDTARAIVTNRYFTIGSMLAIAVCGVIALSSSYLQFRRVLNAPTYAAAPVKTVRKAAPPLPDVRAIAGMSWFGELPGEPVSQDAPVDSSLSQFDLKGVSQSGEERLAGAFIAEKGQPEIYYRKGDALPNNAGRLQDVFVDHVTVKQSNGAIATLNFPGNGSAPNEAPSYP